MLLMVVARKGVLPFDQALNTGIITTLQGMGIVFAVLIVLALLVRAVSLLFTVSSGKQYPSEEISRNVSGGELIVDGIEDEETVVAIMAVVAHNTGSELKDLKFRSIKALD